MMNVLVVDDQATNREYLSTLLDSGRFRVLEAADGVEAMAIVRREKPRVIFSDILMPRMDGYTFVRELRSDPEVADTPVIFWTAHYLDAASQFLARQCGASIVPKPCEPQALLAALEQALGQDAGSLLAIPADDFDREHRKLLTDKLSQQVFELEQANEQLSNANESLEMRVRERTEELRRSNGELEGFAYAAAHDLQAPLRKMIWYSQRAAEAGGERLDSEPRECLERVERAARRMQALVADLLAYSRVGRPGKEIVATRMETELLHALDSVQASLEEAHGRVTYDPLPSVPFFEGQLSTLFQNLIANAIKFRGSEPLHVHVSAERGPAGWIAYVRDNGIGIAPEFSERVFEMFRRLHTDAEYPGNGIGLAICRKIVQLHRGRIWVESEPGKGSCFCFEIPEEVEGGTNGADHVGRTDSCSSAEPASAAEESASAAVG